MSQERILVVAAHPDDEVLGCGGTIAYLSQRGYAVYTLILGEGITARDPKRCPEKRKKELDLLKAQAREASRLLGVKEIFFYDFPDNRFDTVPLLDIVKVVESVIRELQPTVIFTHSLADLNVDHRITHQAVLTATRPFSPTFLPVLYAFEIPSSTEWNFPSSFRPQCYVDIHPFLSLKLQAFQCYESELRESPHPRSLEGLRSRARVRGMEAGLHYAEAFEMIRAVFPFNTSSTLFHPFS
jgi:LmbE family N-acetylglucosaminyl deacetylase